MVMQVALEERIIGKRKLYLIILLILLEKNEGRSQLIYFNFLPFFAELYCINYVQHM